MSLKRLLLLLGVLGGAYVMVIVGYVSAVLLPTASGLRADTEVLLAAHEHAHERVRDLHDAVMGAEALLRGRAGQAPLPTDSAAAQRRRIRMLLSATRPSARELPFESIPDSVRVAFARADQADVAIAASLLSAFDALEAGAFAEAVALVTDADHERSEAEEVLIHAQVIAMSEALLRERALQEATSGAVVVFTLWGVLGALFVLASSLVLRNRLYRPMAQLERALGSVSSGDLTATVAVRPGDEMGRLASLFNHMTGVLLEREAEAERRQQNLIERYSRILEETATALVVVDPATMTVVAANERVLNDLGVGREALEGRSASAVWSAGACLVEDVLLEVARGDRERGVFLADQKRADGSVAKIEVTAFLARDHEAPHIVCVVHDLTERQGLEYIHDQLAHFALENRAVLQSGSVEAAFGKITELASMLLGVEVAGVWLADNLGIRCVDAYDRRDQSHTSGGVVTRLDAPAYFEALESKRVVAAVDARTDVATAELETYLTDENVGALLDVPIRRDGVVVGVVCHEHYGSSRVWTPEEKVLGTAIGDFVIQVLERAEREEAELGRRVSERRYETMFENAAVGIAEVDAEGRFVRANPTLRSMLGYTLEELQTMTWRDVTYSEDRDLGHSAFDEMLAGRLDVHHGEKRCVRKDGRLLWVEMDSALVRSEDGALSQLITVARDVSAARALQDQLAHAQRMDSIGRLAGGIAHDFNNLLTAVLGHAEELRRGLGPDSILAEEVRQIEESARRATGLTRQLLTFARRQVVEPSTVELDALARGAEQLLRRLIGADIELVTELDAADGMMRIDPQQFDQVIVNLTVNARDAVADGGKITIRSRVVDAGGVEGLPILAPETGEFLVLEVADTGKGMSRAVKKRAFEPFFTTKDAGEGTGLGLATCYGIIREAGGHITVDSTEGIGSVFRVFLPRVPSGEQVRPVPLGEPAFVAGKTVLVVEDADPVRRLIVDALERKGYRVLEAMDGQEAVEVAAEFEEAIELVVSDIVMPRLSGPRAVQAIRETRPDVLVLFISGYSADTLRDEALRPEGTAFLSKPFTPTELVTRVNELVERPADAEVGGPRR